MTRTRAWRRHQRIKQINKWKRYYKHWGWYTDFRTNRIDFEAIDLAARRKAQCSCWMCGNPRKYYKGWRGLTIQERRANQGKY